MAVVAIPGFIKSLFDTFPLRTLPPLRPAIQLPPQYRTIPHTTSATASAAVTDGTTTVSRECPTLFVFAMQPESLALQTRLLLRHRDAAAHESLLVVYGNAHVNAAMPYLLLRGTEFIRDPSAHLLSRGGSGGSSSIHIEHEALLEVLENIRLLARYFDDVDNQLIGPWHPILFKPSLKVSRLVRDAASDWETTVLEFERVVDALHFIVKREALGEEEESGEWDSEVVVAVMAHIYVLTQPTQGRRQAGLKKVVERYETLLRARDAWIREYEHAILL